MFDTQNAAMAHDFGDSQISAMNDADVDTVSGGIIPALIIVSFAAGFVAGYMSAQ